MHIKTTLSMAKEMRDMWQETLASDVGKYTIDEMAALFPDEVSMLMFVSDAVREPGVTHVNSADDIVHTWPLESDYSVRYEFLQLQGSPFRIEAMCVAGGYSPLHALRLLGDATSGVRWIHASFSVPTAQEYGQVSTVLEQDWQLVQDCRAHYGRFSYWTRKNCVSGDRIFLKPRVNLRDA